MRRYPKTMGKLSGIESITEAGETFPSKEQALKHFKEMVSEDETMGVIQMYEDAAIKAGATDTEAVLKLIDRYKIKTGENDQVTGVDEAVNALLTAKPYLKGKTGNVTIGAGTAPGQGGQDAPKRFKKSQIMDTEFYRKNEKDILQAAKLNLIENDVDQPAK